MQLRSQHKGRGFWGLVEDSRMGCALSVFHSI
jgi:hypothetical protein